MMTLVLTAVPPGLRGDLTKWLAEISPGVFVGNPSARIRELVWERTVALCKEGRAVLVTTAGNEQRLEFRVHRSAWVPADFDGLTLMRRPADTTATPRRTGWSKARAQQAARRPPQFDVEPEARAADSLEPPTRP
ncbi:type I-E CRISPR-associated endoribonuclease Cas2e [Brevibacterium sp. BRM-1]|uniref:type I-E CRISPR-associated endoribonuclease Cas2e n=1 Tax=Brevibacterium sp. BRM-1 TaxID=2999062 RepID=UPI00227F7AEC|nr:type I-E CRISPR-associated endoribonuclease Cas2e [Brevibacterium sp. BRM-1]WAL39143.1 type I-E CRISPR-associated endoribonuclease Cas2e [Brevibacterium sp. BRM-1]